MINTLRRFQGINSCFQLGNNNETGKSVFIDFNI